MSRTDLDAATLANSLRMRAGDGSIEWVSEPIQASVLLDIADMLDETAKLRDENAELRKLGGFMLRCISQYHDCADCLVNGEHCEISYIEADALELGIEVDE